MSRADLPNRLWGRPVKPLALGLIICLTAIVLNAFITTGISAGDYNHPLAVVAFVTLVLMVWSWVRKSQHLFEWSLLLSAGVFSARAVAVAIESGQHTLSMLPFGVAVFAGGSYVLERADERDGMA